MRTMPFSELKGMTLDHVEVDNNNDTIRFYGGGRTFVMKHYQDCCESVSIESIAGDIADLIGSPITLAEESSSSEETEEQKTRREAAEQAGEYYYGDDSFTWTFYKLATVKGYVDIRWYGSSNGYYSESVDFGEVVNEND